MKSNKALGTKKEMKACLVGFALVAGGCSEPMDPKFAAKAAEMLDRPQIIASTETDSKKPPKTLRAVGIDRILNRTITDWKDYYGSYGMGGPGFFGFELEATPKYPKERLILTLWGASSWLLFDDRWLFALPHQYLFKKPVLDLNDPKARDRFSELVLGATIEEAIFEEQSCRLKIQKGGAAHVFELPADTSKLPKLGGIDKPRKLHPSDRILDAWIVTSSDLLV